MAEYLWIHTPDGRVRPGHEITGGPWFDEFPAVSPPQDMGRFDCAGRYRLPAAVMMKCPYCGCDCDSSAVGDHEIDCRGYGENAETGPDEPPADA